MEDIKLLEAEVARMHKRNARTQVQIAALKWLAEHTNDLEPELRVSFVRYLQEAVNQMNAEDMP
jgi:hypothetical protein